MHDELDAAAAPGEVRNEGSVGAVGRRNEIAGVWNETAGVTFEDMQAALKDAKFPIPKELNMIVEIDHHRPT